VSEFAFDSRRKRSERLAQAPDLSFTNLDVLAAYARDRAKLPKAAVKRHPLTATVDCSAKCNRERWPLASGDRRYRHASDNAMSNA
jgi:hypothetical protein